MSIFSLFHRNNDAPVYPADTLTARDGSQIVLRAHIKPTPSIFSPQDTVNRQNEEIQISIRGRHDPVIVPRAVVVVESMAAITLLDALLVNAGAKMDHLKAIYKN